MLISLDLGVINLGAAVFVRTEEGVSLEMAFQLRRASAMKEAEIANMVYATCVKLALSIKQKYMKIHGLPTADRVKNLCIAIEAADPHNKPISRILTGIKACAMACIPWATLDIKIITITPESARVALGIDKVPGNVSQSTAWRMRKAKTARRIAEFFPDCDFSRHDTTDAIGIGLAALLYNRVTLHPLIFPHGCLDEMFDEKPPAPAPEVAPAPQEIEVTAENLLLIDDE